MGVIRRRRATCSGSSWTAGQTDDELFRTLRDGSLAAGGLWPRV